MGSSIWDDVFSSSENDYYEELERQKSEEKEYQEWYRIRNAEPGDSNYDEFDSLISVEEYIEENRDSLTYEEIRALKDEYGILDVYKKIDYARVNQPNKANQSNIVMSKTTEKQQNATQQSTLTPSISKQANIILIIILSVLTLALTIWAIIDIISLLSVIILIVAISFLVYLFAPIFRF